MYDESSRVPWEEVAASYLSTRLSRSSFRDWHREFQKLREQSRGMLEHLLKYEVHCTSSVRHVLLKEPDVEWHDAELPLGPLRMGPGRGGTDFWKIVSGQTENQTVEEFCAWLDRQPLSGLLAMDESITSFIPTRPLPDHLRQIIVGDRDYRKTGQPLGDRILAGYHRAVILYLLRRRSVQCYYAVKP
jgi:hypothetical protein